MLTRIRDAWGLRPERRGLVVIVATALFACGDPEPTTAPRGPGPAIRLAISPPGMSLVVGESGLLSARAFDSEGHSVVVSVEWSSADPAIASVSTDGLVSAVAVGSSTVTATAGHLSATAIVSVWSPNPPVELRISPAELILPAGANARLAVQAFDAAHRPTTATFEWSSADADVATVSATGIVTAIAPGTTTITVASGSVRATATVRVETANFLMQWATAAAASSEYTATDWSAMQATGVPNAGCADDVRAWASFSSDGVEWLELTYDKPVRPSEIEIYEVWAPGSIAKVEVKDVSGVYHTVYTAQPSAKQQCMHTLTIPVTTVNVLVSKVRLTIDQSVIRDWNEIDAVRLTGNW